MAAYLEQLKSFKSGEKAEHADSDIITSLLLEESNRLLESLGWDETKSRDYLLKKFNFSSRRLLSLIQLIDFNQSLIILINDNSN